MSLSQWPLKLNKDFWFRTAVVVVVAILGLAYQTHVEGIWSVDGVRARFNIYRLRSVLKTDPTNSAALVKLGVNQYVLKNLDQSLMAYSQAVEISPDNFVAWNNLGNVKRDLMDFWGAEDAYLQALEIRPDYSASCINLADLYTIWPIDEEGEKKAKQIVPLLQRGIEANPDNEDLQAALKAYVSANK